jgi:EAL domain-containing protein (putative c-di-GMP-specific phosphodiesterase class I)
LAAIQLRQNNLSEQLQKILTDTGLSADYLELEISESILLNDIRNTMSKLSNIKKSGINVAIDDFGTGYSILRYLKDLPNPKLKIESSFVQDLNTDLDGKLIVRSIIGLAHNLKLKVIAEGVETAEQLEFLVREGCDEYQGYFFSKPLTQHDFICFLYSLASCK